MCVMMPVGAVGERLNECATELKFALLQANRANKFGDKLLGQGIMSEARDGTCILMDTSFQPES